MSHPAVMLLARFKSSLSLGEIRKVAEEGAPEFRALAGLQQKYYLQDAAYHLMAMDDVPEGYSTKDCTKSQVSRSSRSPYDSSSEFGLRIG